MRKCEYIYLGDRLSAPKLKGRKCYAIRRKGKCIRGKNGNMLVCFPGIGKVNVLGRRLRKIKKEQP